FGIAEYGRRRVDELSKGNQQKVQIIAALMHEPEIVFLDEPFTGLDPVNSEILSLSCLESVPTTLSSRSHPEWTPT
ncbi:MAG: ATP-binding cassette domain-containing protein, partial [Bacillota bacterium]